MKGACYDCGRDYDLMGDLAVSDGVWEEINPSDSVGGGLLCANCMIERLRECGIHHVECELWVNPE